MIRLPVQWLSSVSRHLPPSASLLSNSPSTRLSHPVVMRLLHTSCAQEESIAPVFQVWGSNTQVGKTVLSVALLRSTKTPSLYVKPVQSGFPQDDDAALVRIHAPNAVPTTLFTYSDPVSPDLAARSQPQPTVSDDLILSKTSELVHDFMQSSVINDSSTRSLGIIETAGGVLSPAPSGSLQADVYRPLRYPAILVGDAKLGGISATISAYEALCIRGYDVPVVVLFANGDGLENEVSIDRHTDNASTSVFLAPSLPPSDVSLIDYLQQHDSREFFENLHDHLRWAERFRQSSLRQMAQQASQVFWYPFTQHASLGKVKVFDSAFGDDITVFENSTGTCRPMIDAMGSWWTNGVGHGNASIAKAMGAAAGRYGHVMFAEAVTQPVLVTAKRLVDGPGAGWASRAFFSDDGSTAVEVALKMAFRKRSVDHPERKHLAVHIIGLQNSYHGDTLGVMHCSEESDFNRSQTPWYEPRGLFLEAPTVALRNGVWTVRPPDWLGGDTEIFMNNREEVFDKERDIRWYREEIGKRLDKVLEKGEVDLGALLIEPVVMGAGGMHMVDIGFQRALVLESRARGIPIIFDEIFTGLWRLGEMSGGQMIGCEPDIATYGKLLTGGTVPLAVTLAREEVLRTFDGSSKKESLLHGHSYTAHPIGCAAAVESMRQYDGLIAERGTKLVYWDEGDAGEISGMAGVERVTVIGTILAVEMKSEENGYAATGAQQVVGLLAEEGIYTRPLGNVVYLMCTPMTTERACRRMTKTLMKLLDSVL